MAAKRFVLVAGNIGAGKTSLTQKLAEKLGWLSGFETVEQNPYLGKFYGDMRAWAFHLQVFLLGQRADQHIAAHAAAQSYILDRSIYEDYHIFARALHELGNLNDEDLATYRRVYQLVIEHLPRPDLLVFLRAPVDALLARIQARGRTMEAGISADYLQLLDRSMRSGWPASTCAQCSPCPPAIGTSSIARSTSSWSLPRYRKSSPAKTTSSSRKLDG